MIIEMTQFQVKPGVMDSDVLTPSQDVFDSFLSGRKGFLGREMLKSGDGTWVDIVRWETMADAQESMKHLLTHPSMKKFETIVDPSSVRTIHLTVAKTY